ncbi:putative permease [Candidatus Methanoperedens nitroreducens]|uniref:Putative permease n=1 Tax=Candidatus Methanoperedens nitratireducens TaxID=1392998 RepID=A0A062V1M1_9EURY|nr:ABC transporter permease [Candidatus Methanoperedens nitroreducens]KCZ70518.1 putative permease [Candidatus Methanoperedens nitroreducens]MDJ1420370.1 ABC transporter permease [Candidatus Methanoperedens sp.]
MLALYNYRGLIWNFVKRDISSKYVGSLLGFYWSVINPIIMLLVYFVVFGLFLKARLPGNDSVWDFALYFSAGFLPWAAFSESVMRASRSIVDNKNYIKKVPFPSEIFPVYTILSEFVNLLIGLAIFMVLFVILKGMPSIYIVLLPIGIILQMMFTLSLSLVFSSATVFFRDTPQILGSLFMIWFWGTPIVYTINVIPESVRWIAYLNPAYYMLEIYRAMLFYGRFPELDKLLPFLMFSIIFLFFSIIIFQKTKRGFSELL